MSEDEEQDRDASREIEVEQSSGETVDISDSGLHYKATISSWERCYSSNLQ